MHLDSCSAWILLTIESHLRLDKPSEANAAGVTVWLSSLLIGPVAFNDSLSSPKYDEYLVDRLGIPKREKKIADTLASRRRKLTSAFEPTHSPPEEVSALR